MPLIIISLYYFVQPGSKNLKKEIPKILESVIKIKHLILAGILALIAVIYIGRTGNFPLLPVPAWEFGKKSMAPIISPNKTIAGAVGGVLTTAIFIIGSAYILDILNIYYVIFAFLFPGVAIMGDLFESCIKRNFGVKDTGTIIPGHGGILDRFDSFIFTAPFTYYFIILFLG